MKIKNIIFLIVFLFISCSQEIKVHEQNQIEFVCEIQNAEKIYLNNEKSTNLTDINFYLFNKKIGLSYHVYSTSSLIVQEKLMIGEYDVYIIGNNGSNLGKLTISELQNLKTEKSLYSYQGQINISENSTSFDFKLTRLHTKIDLVLSVEEKTNIKLELVELFSSAKSCFLFKPNKITERSELIDTPAIYTSSTTTHEQTYYLFENMQGKSSVSEEIGKNPTTSPSLATYFRITAYEGNRKFYIYIYPGKDLINDYNIERNTPLKLYVNIKGTNTIDTRLEIVGANISDFNDKYIAKETATSNLEVNIENAYNNDLTFKYTKASASAGNLMLDGIEILPYTEYPMNLGVKHLLSYSQATQGYVDFNIEIKDKKHYFYRKNLRTQFLSNNINVEVKDLKIINNVHQPNRFSLIISEKDYNGKFDVSYSIKGNFVEDIAVKGKMIQSLTKPYPELAATTKIQVGNNEKLDFTFYPHVPTSNSVLIIVFTISDENNQSIDYEINLGEIQELKLKLNHNLKERLTYNVEKPEDLIDIPYIQYQELNHSFSLNSTNFQPLDVPFSFDAQITNEYAFISPGKLAVSNYSKLDVDNYNNETKNSGFFISAFEDKSNSLTFKFKGGVSVINRRSGSTPGNPEGEINLFMAPYGGNMYSSNNYSYDITDKQLPKYVTL